MAEDPEYRITRNDFGLTEEQAWEMVRIAKAHLSLAIDQDSPDQHYVEAIKPNKAGWPAYIDCPLPHPQELVPTLVNALLKAHQHVHPTATVDPLNGGISCAVCNRMRLKMAAPTP